MRKDLVRSLAVCLSALTIPVPTPAQNAAPAPSQTGAPGRGAAAGSAARVTLELKGVRLDDALQAIAHQSGMQLVYSAFVVPLDRRVSVTLRDVSAVQAVRAVLRGTNADIGLATPDRIVIAKRERDQPVEAADTTPPVGVIGGVVKDTSTDRPLEGAVVTVRGSTLEATTDATGLYVLQHVPSGGRTIVVRMLGYAPKTRTVLLGDGETRREDFLLRMGMARLQEMVTTATGPRRRLEVANDITLLDVDSIVATQPVSSVTELLETRVPGLVVQHTSGAPGDPSRLRLRGVSSVYGNNDPVVIVDGVRVYAAQSAARSGNLASEPTNVRNSGGVELTPHVGFAAPSPLDQIDVNSIETIEVVKGPSAATMYGADAANGVIVITTKAGRPGPARWTVSASRGLSYMPGQYPDAFFRWGHDAANPANVRLCHLTDFTCATDSLVNAQLLNDPELSVLGHGNSTRLSLGVSGGSSALTYSLMGSYNEQTGIIRLPSYEAERFRDAHGFAPPEWMQRPQQLKGWSGTSRLTARLGARANASLTTTLTRETQQRSSLENQLGDIMNTYVDRASGRYFRPLTVGASLGGGSTTLIRDFYQQATDKATNFTNAANLTWRPRGWLTTSVDAGLNVVNRQDAVLLPPDLLPGTDSLGELGSARASSLVSTIRARAMATAPLPLGFRFQLGVGADYEKESIGDLQTRVAGLASGTNGLNGAAEIFAPFETLSDVTTYGWYLEPSLNHRRFSITTGLRFDGGSTYGTKVHLPVFPKLGGSWLISEESWFPFRGVFNTLRLRVAYGHAGVQPGVADRLRLYRKLQSWVDGGTSDAAVVETVGNTQIRPERSTELEGGFDADLLDDRLSVAVTAYRKVRTNALLEVPLAPSVYGRGYRVWKNVGKIRNAGLELSVIAQLVRSDPVTWSATVTMSHDRNVVVSLAPGVEPFNIDNAGRVAPGYPLFGRWALPIRGYADANGNGIIEAPEVQLGDTLVFMGPTAPDYQASLHTTLSFLRGALTVDGGFGYQDGLTQVNQLAKRYRMTSRAMNDPAAPFGEQAAVVALERTDYGLMQTVNTLRFNTLSVAFNAPPSLASHLGARSFSIALQGTNLGLLTNYSGKDPSVNAYGTGNGIIDIGQLPAPRSWQLSIRVGY